MFSPQPHSATDIPINPAARRRPRPSRPTSRVQQRHERSASGLSVDNSTREGSVASQHQDSDDATNLSGDLSIVRKQPTPLAGKEQDGGLTDLTKNDKYRVSKLPSLPRIFSDFTKLGTGVTAYTDSTHRYALLLSHDCAYVWGYTVPHSLPLTFSFPLPREGSSDAQAPFPLGALVSPSANSPEPGLVVVMPMTGRIAYWDAVDSAVSEGLFARRRGVEGKIPTLSNEIITSICNAEPAGFIISTSSGRLAHLALRDNAGRPGVTVTVMRGNTGLGGLLGALRAGSNRRDIVAVRAGKVLRMGEREVIVCTERGIFSRWHVNRSGSYANTTDADLREQILAALYNERALQGNNRDGFQVIDLQVTDYRASGVPGQEDALQLLVLTGMVSSAGRATYALVFLEIMASGAAAIGTIHVIKSYAESWATKSAPRLYLPSPKRTVFVVFNRAVVVISKITQDMSDTGPEYFEDVVDFRGDLRIEIVGSGPEGVENDSIPGAEMIGSFTADQGHIKRIKNPGVVLVAKGAGILRVEAFDVGYGGGLKAVSAPVTVKSKLEQAVFFGTKSDNPLNFLGRKEVTFPVEDLEEAALTTSREIISSKSQYLPAMLPSLGSHLELRSQYLRALITHLKIGAFGTVSKQVQWRLLQDAEKCEASRALWDVRNERLREYPTEGDGVLEAVITEYFPPSETDITASHDPIRSWFQQDIDQIGHLIRMIKKSLAARPNKGKKNQLSFAIADAEANDLTIGALEKAWDFRAQSAQLYGLSGKGGINKEGILRDSNGFPPPWTCDPLLLDALSDQYQISAATLKALWGPTEDPKRKDIISTLGNQLVRLAGLCCKSFEERAVWCEKQSAAVEEIVEHGRLVRERYMASRRGWIKPLVEYYLLDDAYRIAETYKDFGTLVEICFDERNKAEASEMEAKAAQQDSEVIGQHRDEITAINDRLEGYFQRFGEQFATELYGYLVAHGKLKTLLNGFEGWREKYLTPFLHGNPRYAKISWIHDVGRGDYNSAANTLFSVASHSEDKLSNKQIQLSIGKLSKLAALENLKASEVDVEDELDVYDVKLELVEIQQKLVGVVKHISHSAIDYDAAVQLGTDEYARQLKKTPALREIFRKSFKELIKGNVLNVEDLVELLTLMEPIDGEFLDGKAFYWAIKALGLAGLSRSSREYSEKMIWRRCFLRDDWTQIVSTRNRTDEDVAEIARRTSVYTTVALCYKNTQFSPPSPFKPRSPEECLFSENPEEIRIRFPGADENQLAALAHDLYDENRRLRRHISKADLQNWFYGMLAQIKEEAPEETVIEDLDGDVSME